MALLINKLIAPNLILTFIHIEYLLLLIKMANTI